MRKASFDVPSPSSIIIRDEGLSMRLFAVLIGINHYVSPSFPRLRGAVADVDNVSHFLENNLGVPSSQIVRLIDERATRSTIIEALIRLRMDDRIQNGDAILIYYAGHGMQIDQMAAIIPYDCIDKTNKDGLIPYFMLENLLAGIASNKGNNITVVFDCSNSGRGTKFSGFKCGRGARVVGSPSREDEMDQEVFFYRTPQGSTSHVLLAACGPTENAHEINGHGAFTDSLLKLLDQIPPDKLRYTDIIPRLKLSKQTPQCEGVHRNRILFSSVSKQPDTFFLVQYAKNIRGRYYVYAGTQRNVTLDTNFSINRKRDLLLNQKITVLFVDELYRFFTTAELPDYTPDLEVELDGPIAAIAIVDKKPEEKTDYFRIHIPLNNNFLRVYREMEEVDKSVYNPQDETQGSHAEILFTNKELEVRTTIRTVNTHYEFHHIIKDFDTVQLYLPWMAHFYRKLNLLVADTATADDESRRLNHGNIGVEFYQLREVSVVAESTGFLDEKLEPMDRNLYIGGKINLVVADEYDYAIPYGLKLVNRSDQDLYVNLFHFANSDLSISPCISVSLKQQSDLTIGYGPEGYSPICYEIADRCDKVDVGYLKIYLSTESVDLDHLTQPPFTEPETETSVIGRYTPTSDPWMEIAIPIIQTRTPCDRESVLSTAYVKRLVYYSSRAR